MIPNILTPSGYVPLTSMSIGDDVIAYDINDGHIILNQLESIDEWTEANSPVDEDGNYTDSFDWYLINGTIKLFKYQSIWVNMHPDHVLNLQIGDIIYDESDNDIIVNSIELTTPEPIWYRLHISGDHSYIADGITLHNATRTISIAGGSYNATTTWDEGSFPLAADDVVARGAGNSGNLTITGASAALTANFTNYTGTCTINSAQNWVVGANGGSIVFRLVSGMTLSGTGQLSIANTNGNTCTLTSAGKSIPWSVNFGSTVNYTMSLVDDWTFTNTVNWTGAGSKTFNGGNLYLQGNIGGGSSSTQAGTSSIFITGNANQSLSSCNIDLPVEINKTGGTLTIGATVSFRGTSFKYTNGTVTVTNGVQTNFVQQSLTLTINATSNITWQNVLFLGNLNFTSTFLMSGTINTNNTGSSSITGTTFISGATAFSSAPNVGTVTFNLDGNLSINGNLTTSSTQGVVINTNNIVISGDLLLNGTNAISGTGGILMSGTNKSITVASTSTVGCNLTINSPTITLSSGSTLNLNTGSNTFKLNNNLLGTGIVAVAGSSRIDGGGNSLNNLWVTTAGVTVTLVSGLLVNTQFQSLAGTAASRVLFTSSSAGTQRKFTLVNSTSTNQAVMYTNATDIDSGDGLTVWSFGDPTLNNTINWNNLSASGKTEGFIISNM